MDRAVSSVREAPSQGDVLSVRFSDAERSYIKSVLPSLTSRELDVVLALCGAADDGRASNEDLADRLCIALPTLRTHLMRIYQKIGVGGKPALVRLVVCALLEGYRQGRLGPSLGSEAGDSRPLSVEVRGLRGRVRK